MSECSACGGNLAPITDWASLCDECGGLHATERAIPALVRVDEAMLAGARNERYFDITRSNGERVHGWFDVLSRRVTQYG